MLLDITSGLLGWSGETLADDESTRSSWGLVIVQVVCVVAIAAIAIVDGVFVPDQEIPQVIYLILFGIAAGIGPDGIRDIIRGRSG